MSLEPLKKGDLVAGEPLSWAVYDASHTVLFPRGAVIGTVDQLDELMSRGLFRRVSGTPRPSAGGGEEGSREELKALDEIKLGIGDSLQLQAQTAGAPVRYYVKLIGYLRGKGVIVTTPVQDGKVLLMREGQSFVVRLFSGKSAYAFPATIYKVANVPYPHLHLTWPGQVKGLVVRRGARARVDIIAAVQDSDGRAHAATLGNLSTGGCSLLAKAPLGLKGSRLRLKFRVAINGGEQYLHLEGIVRSVQADVADDAGFARVQHGIQFAEMPPGEEMVLTAYVYQKLFEDAADA